MLDPHVNDIEQTVSSVATSLLHRARAREQDAWDVLVDLYAPLVYEWCRRRGLDPEEARDVGQDVFAAVSRGIDGFDRSRENGTFRGWLRTITDNKIRDHWRRENSLPKTVDAKYAIDAAETPTASSSLQAPGSEDRKIFIRILQYARDQINPEHWQVFWQVAVEEREPADVAADFEMKRHNVYMIKSRVLRMLRDLFEISSDGGLK